MPTLVLSAEPTQCRTSCLLKLCIVKRQVFTLFCGTRVSRSTTLYWIKPAVINDLMTLVTNEYNRYSKLFTLDSKL